MGFLMWDLFFKLIEWLFSQVFFKIEFEKYVFH